MKEKISNSIFISFRIWASAWLAFLVSIVPLLIWRSTREYKGFGENLLMSVIGLIFGFLFMMLLQMRDESAHRFEIRDTVSMAVGGIGLYTLLWLLVFLPYKNNYIVAVLGYHLSYVICTGVDGRPTFLASLASALIFGLLYFFAVLAGTKIAHKRHSRFLKDIKENK